MENKKEFKKKKKKTTENERHEIENRKKMV